MKESIKMLLGLQEKDLELDRMSAELSSVPGKISAVRSEIEASKIALEDSKKDVTQLLMTKKQKDLDLETQEGAIRKHSTELNAVKTNDAYRALLGEIDKAKQTKSALEDQILQLMDQIDQGNKAWKEKEASFKGNESGLLKQISDLESKQKDLEQTIATKRGERETAAAALPKELSGQYEKLRAGRRGAAVVPIRREQCSGCHMKVSQNLINEVRRGQKMMTCESCSRIVYLEDAEEPAVKPTGEQAVQ